MRILVAHSRYMTGPVSGENRVVDDEVRLLREAGHDVLAWTPEPTPPEQQAWHELLRTGAGAVWSRRASDHLRRRIREHRPEVVHFHNLYPVLSPAVIRAAHGEGVPTVVTLHNYRLFCLPATLERDGAICERCVGHLPLAGIRYRCYRDSLVGSAVVAKSLTLHRWIGTFREVSRYLPVSEFVRAKYLEAGFDAARLRVKPNFTWGTRRREGPGGPFLYVGRLSREKGIDRVLDAWTPDLGRLVVVGSGPEEAALRARAGDGVEFLGALEPSAVAGLIAEARALLVPSLSYETSGRSALEAFAAGVPVIASRVGAIPEAVEDGANGLLIDDPEGWPSALRRLDDDESVRLGEGAFRTWEARYGPDHGLAGLEAAYAAALEGPR